MNDLCDVLVLNNTKIVTYLKKDVYLYTYRNLPKCISKGRVDSLLLWLSYDYKTGHFIGLDGLNNNM